MNVKRFTAPNSRDALKQVRLAFGRDAVVLSTRPCADGVEVLAMAPDAMHEFERVAMPANPQPEMSAQRELPAGIATVGDMARLIAVSEIPAEGAGARLAAHARVLEEVRRLIADFLHVPLEKVQPESDLVRDLGID